MPASEQAENDTATLRLTIPDMDCPSCAGNVAQALQAVDGILEYETHPTSGTAIITYNPDTLTYSEIVATVEAAGYSIDTDDTADDTVEQEKTLWTGVRGIKTWISGVFLIAGLVTDTFITADPAIASILSLDFMLTDIFYILGIIAGGQIILKNGYQSAKNFRMDIHFLMSAAIISAVLASLLSTETSLYFEAATLAFLFNIANLLETYSIGKARRSLRELMDLAPETATVKNGDKETVIPVEDVAVGDTITVRPGEKIPMDSIITTGETAVNQAPITGESIPVDKQKGDTVYAGTINRKGYIEATVTATATENTIAQIIQMVEEAETEKTEHEQFVEKFSRYYTPFMVTVAVLTAAVPPLLLGYSWSTWFVAGITLLVLACPCAFVIATPVSVVSGVTSAAKNGVLIKGGTHLESMGDINTIAVDKTGTLTTGDLTVTDVIPLNDHTVEDVLASAHGVEERSEHPIGEAIVSYAEKEGIARPDIDSFQSLTGKGVKATLAGTQHQAGTPDMFEDLGFDLHHTHVVEGRADLKDELQDMCDKEGRCLNLIDDTIPRLQSQGKTVILVGSEDEIEGLIAVADALRPEARETVRRLQEQGVRVVMLTGDNRGTAHAIANDAGIDEYHAELLPDEKVAKITELEEKYGGVAMVGDGINDAPAMATATVGIAMGAAGTDTALETADIALMGDDLSRLPYLHNLSHKARRVIRQNIWTSLGVKAVLAIGVPLQMVSVALAVLVGDAGMTVGVTGNALRLSHITPDQ